MSYFACPLPTSLSDIGFYFDRRGYISIYVSPLSKKKRIALYIYNKDRAFVEAIKKKMGYGLVFRNRTGWCYRISPPLEIKDFLTKTIRFLRYKEAEVGYLLHNWNFNPPEDYNKDFSIEGFKKVHDKTARDKLKELNEKGGNDANNK